MTPPLVCLTPSLAGWVSANREETSGCAELPAAPTFCTFPPHNNLLIPLSGVFIFSLSLSLVLIPFFLFSVCALPHSPAVRPGGQRPVPGVQRLEARSHGPDGQAEVVFGPPQHAPSGPAHETGFNRRCGRTNIPEFHFDLSDFISLS